MAARRSSLKATKGMTVKSMLTILLAVVMSLMAFRSSSSLESARTQNAPAKHAAADTAVPIAPSRNLNNGDASSTKPSSTTTTTKKTTESSTSTTTTPSSSSSSSSAWVAAGGKATASQHATVMGMATNLHVRELRSFVGSLRKTGYSGSIILGLAPAPQKQQQEQGDTDEADNDYELLLTYLNHMKVTTKIIHSTNCTYKHFEASSEDGKEDARKNNICGKDYPDVKLRWLKYPLGRDWLKDCESCTGPVLLTDVRDTFFQRDPFDSGFEVKGLQVVEEHVDSTTSHWLTDWPIHDCKGIHLGDKPMLCSGTTIGTYDAMMDYLNTMYEEMKVWINTDRCRFATDGDDQSIHNWLYYNGDFAKGGRNVVAVANRDSIVHTVGYQAGSMFDGKNDYHRAKGAEQPDMEPYLGATDKTWISVEESKGLVNEAGDLLNFDKSLSPVIHQFDRLGLPYLMWIDQQDYASDEDGSKFGIVS